MQQSIDLVELFISGSRCTVIEFKVESSSRVSLWMIWVRVRSIALDDLTLQHRARTKYVQDVPQYCTYLCDHLD